MSDSDPITRLNAALEGRYHLERELGEGGMATVYLADDLKHQRKVALKVLKPELAAVVGAERFLAEIKTTATLQHPHILPLFDSGEVDSFLFYVMPYIEGETLRERIDREKQLPIDEALGIATAVANALATAHEQGIIHRDIKPSNILLSRGEALVSDFGIAIVAGGAGGNRLTETGLSVGTPYYMSPEQATGDQAVGPASDVYALACVLYEMLVGEPPYLGKTAQAVLGKIIQGVPVSATAVRKSIPRNVDAALRKALERLPADRFTGAHSFAEALANPGFVHGDAGIPVGGVRSAWKTAAIAASTVAVALAVLSLWALRPEPEQPRLVHRFASPFQEGQGPVRPVQIQVISQDGSLIIYRSPSESGVPQLWARRLGELVATPLRDTERASPPVLSPDGDEMAFSQGGEVMVLPLRGGQVRSLGVQSGLPTAWGSDGYLYFFTPEEPLFRVPASGGPREQVSPAVEAESSMIADILPGASFGLMVGEVNLQGPEIRSVDLVTGVQKALLPGFNPRFAPTGHIVYQTIDGLLMAVRFDPDRQEILGVPVELLQNIFVFVLSRTGTLLYGTRPTTAVREVEPVWITRSGEISSVDPGWTFALGPDANWGIRLSPDGTQLAVRHYADGNYDIWVKQLRLDGPFSRITLHEADEWAPRWSVDGDTITFISRRGGQQDMWQRAADGTGAGKLVYDHGLPLAQGFLSPDGEWVVMRTRGAADQPGARDILIARLGVDSVARPLLTEEYGEVAPEISPDGHWLLYLSDETGRFEAFVRPFPNVDDGKVQVSNSGANSPLWSRDGQELFYQDSDAQLISVSFETEPEFRVVERTPLFTVPVGIANRYRPGGFITGMYDVAPNGRFLMIRRVAAAEPEPEAEQTVEEPRVFLVLNWFEELKQRVGN